MRTARREARLFAAVLSRRGRCLTKNAREKRRGAGRARSACRKMPPELRRRGRFSLLCAAPAGRAYRAAVSTARQLLCTAPAGSTLCRRVLRLWRWLFAVGAAAPRPFTLAVRPLTTFACGGCYHENGAKTWHGQTRPGGAESPAALHPSGANAAKKRKRPSGANTATRRKMRERLTAANAAEQQNRKTV